MQDVQGQSTSGASAISQAAAVAALTGDQDLLTESAEIFRKSRDSVPGAINDEPLLSCALPDGAILHLCILRKGGWRTASDGCRLFIDGDFCHYLLA